MSIDLYQTGVSGLLAAQQQLATTGHNIANVNTEGYNRQRTEQGTSVGLVNGGKFVGSGTYVNDITRIYDQFSHREQVLNQSNQGYASTLSINLNHLNDIMNTSGTAINNSIDQFYQAINGITDNPSDIGLRNIAVNNAQRLANDFNTLHRHFDDLEKATNGEIDEIAKNISQISLEIADINQNILTNNDLTLAGQPNDLLDKRDQLINQLAEYTSVNTLQDANGVMTVMIGSGTTLVAGITPLTLSVQSGDPDQNQTQLMLHSHNGDVGIDEARLGGALGAKFEYRDQHLVQARNEINRLAMVISETLNQTQAQGLDLDGMQGDNFFTDINSNLLQTSRVLAHSGNTGNLESGVKITDVSKVPTSAFEIRFDGTDYIMTNQADGSETNLGAAGAGSYNTPYGFEFVENSGVPNTDDVFTIRPSENSAALMSVTLTDGKNIAASSAIEASANENNIGGGNVNIINVSDPEQARTFTEGTNSQLTVDVYESTPGTFEYRVYDAANPPPAPVLSTGNFTAGNTAVIDMPPAPAISAFQIEISGQPVGQGSIAREKFTIADAFGQGNSSNALAMANTEHQSIINNGNQTFSQSISITSATIGSNASSSELVANTAEALYTQAYNRNQATSGVNLDEEAANMIKFQQAYQASSRIISVANTIFDSLLAAV